MQPKETNKQPTGVHGVESVVYRHWRVTVLITFILCIDMVTRTTTQLCGVSSCVEQFKVFAITKSTPIVTIPTNHDLSASFSRDEPEHTRSLLCSFDRLWMNPGGLSHLFHSPGDPVENRSNSNRLNRFEIDTYIIQVNRSDAFQYPKPTHLIEHSGGQQLFVLLGAEVRQMLLRSQRETTVVQQPRKFGDLVQDLLQHLTQLEVRIARTARLGLAFDQWQIWNWQRREPLGLANRLGG